MNINYTQDMTDELSRCLNSSAHFLYKFTLKVDDETGVIYNFSDSDVKSLKSFHDDHTIVHHTTDIDMQVFASYFLWYTLFNRDKSVVYLSKNFANSKKFLLHIKRMYDNLPEYMTSEMRYCNTGYIEFANGCRIMISAATDNALRGQLFSLICFDDFSKYRKPVAELYIKLYPQLVVADKIIYNN